MQTKWSPTLDGAIATAVPAGQRPVILVVEDEPDRSELLSRSLQSHGYDCVCVQNGRDALERAVKAHPDLILLDLVLPDLPGEAVLAQLRRRDVEPSKPVIVMTARGTEADQLIGLSLGADDYIAKPFSMPLLLARIAAILRRTRPDGFREPNLVLGPFHFAVDCGRLTVHGADIKLTQTEFQLLGEIAAKKGRIARRGDLMNTVFGSTDPFDRRLDVHIANLRKKLGDDATWIVTVRGIGYAVQDPSRSGKSTDAANSESA